MKKISGYKDNTNHDWNLAKFRDYIIEKRIVRPNKIALECRLGNRRISGWLSILIEEGIVYKVGAVHHFNEDYDKRDEL